MAVAARLLALAGALLLGACAGTPKPAGPASAGPAAAAIELAAVPFFPQEPDRCGPAALAMVLTYSGVAVTPEALEPEVFLPGREGSLQIELLGASRRAGRVAYPIDPAWEALLAELEAGRPVLVLLNLAFNWRPFWHYAVVVGFEPRSGTVLLRSGREARRELPLELFERLWDRAAGWGMVALGPGELPAAAEARAYLRALAAAEAELGPAAAADSYRAALGRWPGTLAAQIGLGVNRYRGGDLAAAVAAFTQALRDHPESAAAHNNLAHVLGEMGMVPEALASARAAVRLGGLGNPAYAETLAALERRQAAGR